VLGRKEEGFSEPGDIRFRLELAEMSPELEVKPWEEKQLYIVKALTSSGGEDILTVNAPAGGRAQRTSFMELLFADWSDAEGASRFLSRAIRACMGAPRSTQAVQRAAHDKAARDSASPVIDESNLPPEVVRNLIGVCQARVREKLKAPGSARFTAQPTVVGEKGKSPVSSR
jgi:hypothetical protein